MPGDNLGEVGEQKVGHSLYTLVNAVNRLKIREVVENVDVVKACSERDVSGGGHIGGVMVSSEDVRVGVLV